MKVQKVLVEEQDEPPDGEANQSPPLLPNKKFTPFDNAGSRMQQKKTGTTGAGSSATA